MLTRRILLAAPVAALAAPAGATAAATAAAPGTFQSFLAGVRADARKAGVSQATLDRALANIAPNQKVLDRDRKQPEFTMTWLRYRALVITDKRIGEGRIAVAENKALLSQVQARYGVGAGVLAGIWGLESSFGQHTGDFNIVEALATLAWEGRRATFFRGELMAALQILDRGDVSVTKMTGSYAGAMGQPQFMPTSYLRLAVDFDGDGKRDIWNSKPDVFGSIGNYLAQSGWKSGEAWGQQVTLPPGFDVSSAGREHKRPLSEWIGAGVRPRANNWRAAVEAPTAIVIPDARASVEGQEAQSEAFAAYANFTAIRRYNPSDFYAIAVGLLGDELLT